MKSLLTNTLIACSFLTPASAGAQTTDCASAPLVVANTIYTLSAPYWISGGHIVDECSNPVISGNAAFWYAFIAPYTGPIEITSCLPTGSAQDTRLSVFAGSCEPSACVGADADHVCEFGGPLRSKVTFDAVAGETYYIQWDNAWMMVDPPNFAWVIHTCESAVQGTAFFDLNANAVKEPSEPVFNGLLLRDGQMASQSGSEPFLVCSPYGEHVLTLASPPPYHTVTPASHTYTTSEENASLTGMDFALQPIPGMLDGAVQLYGASPWIGNNTAIWLPYQNIGTASVGATLEFHLDTLLQFVSASVAPTNMVGNTITWDLGTLPPYTAGTIQVTVYTPPTVPWNTQLTHWATLVIDGTDVDGSNNHVEWQPFVVAAYDPNDKQVTRETLTPDEVADGVQLGYTIRFQNTGNAPAVNVIIRDTIDAGLDLTSFEMVGATHPYQLSINGNEFVWLFQNIMLPDSTTDFDGSIGTFHYRIAVREGLLLGDQVQNEAHIFFDYAEPIVTNTVTTTVALPVGLREADGPRSLLVHPLPSTGLFHLRWLEGSLPDARVRVTDGLGRDVLQLGPTLLHKAQDLPIDLSDQPNGIYAIFITGTGATAHGRVVISR
jgi:uncharacterized repeat protein (TIGR01451 family)